MVLPAEFRSSDDEWAGIVERDVDLDVDAMVEAPARLSLDVETGLDVQRGQGGLALARRIHGSRLSYAQGDEVRDELRELREDFKLWQHRPDYLVLTRHSPDGCETHLIMAAKRGNAVYRFRVRRRIAERIGGFEDRAIIERDARCGRTNILFLSLTYDQTGLSISDAWARVGEDWNRTMAALRNRYGRIAELRGWEAQQNGYPHVHALLIFLDRAWSVVRHESVLGRQSWRLPTYSEKQDLAVLWPYGNVDVQGIDNPARGLSYVLKYILGRKGSDGSTSRSTSDDLTLSLLWVYGKRQYGISGADLIGQGLIQTGKAPSTAQMDLNGAVAVGTYWIFGGIVEVYGLGDDPPWEINASEQPGLVRQVSDAIDGPKRVKWWSR